MRRKPKEVAKARFLSIKDGVKEEMTLKKFALIIVAMLYLFIVVGCESQITEEKARMMLEENRDIFTTFADSFSKQGIVHMAALNSNRMGARYYTILLQNDIDENGLTFKVPAKYKKNDEDFWENDPGQIVSTEESGAVTVREMLQENQMTANDFHIWRLFLRNHELLSIGRSGVNGLVEIRINPKNGYIYAPEAGEHLVAPEGVQLIPIDDHWSFFTMK